MNQTQLLEAISILKIEESHIDFALLVGGLAAIQKWADAEPALRALGKESMCDRYRKEGQRLIDEAEAENQKYLEEHVPMVLQIYQISPGNWAGMLLVGDDQIGITSGHASPEAVKEATLESGVYPDSINVVAEDDIVEKQPAFIEGIVRDLPTFVSRKTDS